MKTSSALVLCVSLALVGCPKNPGASHRTLDEAAERAQGGSSDGRVLAFAGFHALLVQGDPKLAQSRFDQALAAAPRDPYAIYGELTMSQRRSHPERVLALALDLCEKAPDHPLAAVAAREVNDLSGIAGSLDDLIVRRAPVALGKRMRGDAAYLLRSALAHVHDIRAEDEPHQHLLADMGVLTEVAIAGPFSPYHLLSFDEQTEPEKTGSLENLPAGPLGPLTARKLSFPDGSLLLSGEGYQGDVYLLAADVDVPESGTHVLRTVSTAPHKVWLDGQLVLQRRTMERTMSTVGAQGISLSRGRHRLLVKLSRQDSGGGLTLSLMRADGERSGVTFHAAAGAPHRWNGGVGLERTDRSFPEAKDLVAALEDEAGGALARFLAIDDGMGRDRDGAKALVDELANEVQSPAVSELRAEVALGDRTVPSKVARGRATRDLEAATAKDKGDVRALLLRSAIAVDDGRAVEAAELVRQARSASGGASDVGFPVLMQQAKVELALEVEAQADQTAQAALELQPGLCEAAGLRYNLARKRDAIALSDELVAQLQPCPGALGRLAEHARARGDVARTLELQRLLTVRDPASLSASLQLASTLQGQKQFAEAERELRRSAAVWPRSREVYKRLGDLAALAGKPAEALAFREQALALDGSDLPLRRIVERAKTGKELLADQAISGKDAIAAYEAARGSEDASAAYVLDAAAIQAFPDGSMVDRIHTIQKVLDRSEVGEIAEVSVPQGAEVLSLRTIKPDGTVLEPEQIEGKESVSLPGVEVGDYLEFEYLYAHPARGPELPGFTASNFYFQIARRPNAWSTYTVIAPKGAGMKVDAHNMASAQPQTKGDLEVYFHEERNVPPYIPEPDGPPSANEYLPFVSVGAGAQGNDGVVNDYGDAALDRGRITYEVRRFAEQAAGKKHGLEAAHAIYAAVMEQISGPDGGLSQSAASAVAQGRGSRLWLLKASLEAVGLPARIAFVRTFASDPNRYLFPNEQQIGYGCVRVELDGKVYWLDPTTRFAPFGELPEGAEGGLEAWLMPEPGRPLEKTLTPKLTLSPSKQVKFQLTLAEDGTLEGSGEELYQGMEAAQLSEALEQINPEQRTQVLQQALSRYFGGAELSKLKLENERKVGAPLALRYEFSVPGFARAEGDAKKVLPPLTLPAKLGRRYVQLGSRRTPLFIDSTDQNRTEVTLTLPKGWKLQGPVAELKSGGKYGSFVRHEKQAGEVVTLDEQYRIERGRIPANEYEAFGQFAGEVDLFQGRDLVIEKK